MQSNVRVQYLYLNDELDATVYLSGNQACAPIVHNDRICETQPFAKCYSLNYS